jgi:uncharacterized repeat protein (TIGR03803 family)
MNNRFNERPTETRVDLLVLVAALGWLMAGRVAAQTFTVLHSFTAGDPGTGTNQDGAQPFSQLVLSASTLYGTAQSGGSTDDGTVFALKTDGTGFTTLHSFTQPDNFFHQNSDGFGPTYGMMLSENTLYGTTEWGGSAASGTVFALSTDGTGFRVLYNGGHPNGPLMLSGDTLYGTTSNGGASGAGSVFALATNGTGFTVLHDFTPLSNGNSGINSDGAYPGSGLLLSGNTLYGIASYGGSSSNGTMFSINTDGTDFTTLYNFTGANDGGAPVGLVLAGNNLYGIADSGGISMNGTVFALNTDGTNFRILYSFGSTSGDGSSPQGLILSAGTLYGTTANGGSSGNGVAFAINTNGTGFSILHSFTQTATGGTNSDGANPWGGVILSGNTLYGTTAAGGSSGNGTVFSISLSPQLTITRLGKKVVVTWPANYAGFDYTGYSLQSSTNLVSPHWTTVSPAPVILNGQNMVTNPISASREFYRLAQ